MSFLIKTLVVTIINSFNFSLNFIIISLIFKIFVAIVTGVSENKNLEVTFWLFTS